MGGNSPYGEYFQGLIDEVRIYNRALAQAEIQADMTTPIGPVGPDTPPTAPTGLTAAAANSSQINLSWGASTDNVAVTGYRVERCQGAGCTNFVQVLTPTGTSVSDTGLCAGTSYSYRVRATDAAGNLSSYSNSATATTAQTNPVVIENLQPGSSVWQLGDIFGRLYATDDVSQIKGYASAVSVNKGESIDFYVSVDPA